MELIPALRVTRFEQLDAGELFISFSGHERFYALKTLRERAPTRRRWWCWVRNSSPAATNRFC
jgi:Lon protease-like protein